MKILIIAPYYYPYINPRAHRWTVLAEHWAKEGMDVHVVCSKHPDFAKEQELNGVQIHRVGFNSLKEIFYNLLQNKSRRGVAEKQSIRSAKPKRSYLKEFILFLNNRLLKPFYFPDDAFLWLRPARRKSLQLLTEQKFDVLISVALPFTAHVIGLACKKQFLDLQWIADMGDPFAIQAEIMGFSKRQAERAFNLEKKILKQVSYFSLTNKGAVEVYKELFPNINVNYRIIPPLSSFGEKQEQQKYIDIDKELIHIGFFGSFFPKVREPNAILALLTQIKKQYPIFGKKIRLHFFGNIFENFLPTFHQFSNIRELLIFHGMHDRKHIISIMQQMDVLLNMGNSSTHQLPSKSVDYLFSGKPILNLCSIKKDTVAAFFKDYPLILNLDLEIELEDLVEDCKEFIMESKGKMIKEEEWKKWTKLYELKAISEAYKKLFFTEENNIISSKEAR